MVRKARRRKKKGRMERGRMSTKPKRLRLKSTKLLVIDLWPSEAREVIKEEYGEEKLFAEMDNMFSLIIVPPKVFSTMCLWR